MEIKNQLIRGARIIQQMNTLMEAPYAELEQKTMKFTPTTTKRQYAIDSIRVTSMELTPAVESQNLRAVSTVNSEGTNYTVSVSFDNVIYDQDDQASNVSFKAVTGDEQHIQRIELRRVNCKVSCDCLDFYWRFATQNAKVNSLDNKAPPPYHKRTNRPPANQQNTPGVCKHIMKTIIALRDAGIVN
jgi:hypothetical protein